MGGVKWVTHITKQFIFAHFQGRNSYSYGAGNACRISSTDILIVTYCYNVLETLFGFLTSSFHALKISAFFGVRIGVLHIKNSPKSEL